MPRSINALGHIFLLTYQESELVKELCIDMSLDSFRVLFFINEVLNFILRS